MSAYAYLMPSIIRVTPRSLTSIPLDFIAAKRHLRSFCCACSDEESASDK